MGLETINKRRYLAIVGGKLQERVDTTVTKEYTHLSHVHLVNIAFRKVKKDKNDNNSEIIGELLQLHFIDETEYYVIEMWANGPYASCFYKMMENIELNFEIVIIPEEKVIDGKKKASLYLKQFTSFIKWRYTKASPEDCPPLIEDIIVTPAGDTKIIWKNDLQIEYFYDKIALVMLPALKKKNNPFPSHPQFSGIVQKGELAGDHFGQPGRSVHMSGGADLNPENISQPLDDLPF